jgi:hypothetical protein
VINDFEIALLVTDGKFPAVLLATIAHSSATFSVHFGQIWLSVNFY